MARLAPEYLASRLRATVHRDAEPLAMLRVYRVCAATPTPAAGECDPPAAATDEAFETWCTKDGVCTIRPKKKKKEKKAPPLYAARHGERFTSPLRVPLAREAGDIPALHVAHLVPAFVPEARADDAPELWPGAWCLAQTIVALAELVEGMRWIPALPRLAELAMIYRPPITVEGAGASERELPELMARAAALPRRHPLLRLCDEVTRAMDAHTLLTAVCGMPDDAATRNMAARVACVQ
jgi:hypothetical protein